MLDRLKVAASRYRQRAAARRIKDLEDFSNTHLARQAMRREADEQLYHQDLTTAGGKGLPRFGR